MSRDPASSRGMTRRDFVKSAAVLGAASACAPAVRASIASRRPNVLFINLDQHSCEAMGHMGCAHVATPNLDRLARAGVSFAQSYSTDPVCCPARSSWFSGRMTPETGVVYNNRPMTDSMPDLGQWMRDGGYNAYYTGKWHIPGRTLTESFDVIADNPKNTADLGDIVVTRSAEGFLRNYAADKPFFLSVGLLNPHDICSFVLTNAVFEGRFPYKDLVPELPSLPPNFRVNMTEPAAIVGRREKYLGSHGIESNMARYEEEMWRYYVWTYYRYIEKVDGQVGLILDTLESSRHASDTVVILSSDHGDGHCRHQMVFKSFLYDEAARVPFIVSWPGRMAENVIDRETLVSGVDLFPTVCDFTGIAPAPNLRGRSLRAVAEGRGGPTADFVVAHSGPGRMIRTRDYKYIEYADDTAVQLFDMKKDPWETANLAGAAGTDSVVAEHRRELERFVAAYDVAPQPKGKPWMRTDDE